MPKRMLNTMTQKNILALIGAVLASITLTGCNPPETVAQVDLNRYAGLWYQVAGYPFGPTDDLVGITAEYTALEDGTVKVVNRGFVRDFNAEEDVIEGIATVVDTESNAKLSVSFPSVLGGLIKGQYWIITLDETDYSYAVVSDPFRSTLYILSRTPVLPQEILDSILLDLGDRGFDLDKIYLIPQMEEPLS